MRPLSSSLPIVGAVFGLAAAIAACGGDGVCTADASSALSSEGGPEAGSDATATDSAQGGEEGGPVGEPEAAGPVATLAGVRLANWSADSPPVDFCLAPHGTTAFEGPILAAKSAESDGGSCEAGGPGLAFPEVSAYLLLPPRQYDARVVVAGASDCSVKLVDDNRALPVLTPGTWMTLALLGEANPVGGASGLETAAFLDTGVASGTGISLRFINAAANVTTAELGTQVAANSVAPVFPNVQFGQAGTLGTDETDAAELPADTYIPIAAPSGQTLVVITSPGASGLVASATGVSIAAGAVVTLTLVGPIASSDGGSGAQLLECIDNAGTVCATGDCRIVSH